MNNRFIKLIVIYAVVLFSACVANVSVGINALVWFFGTFFFVFGWSVILSDTNEKEEKFIERIKLIFED